MSTSIGRGTYIDGRNQLGHGGPASTEIVTGMYPSWVRVTDSKLI